MRLQLRWKILLFTVPPLLALTLGTIWMINRSMTRQVQDNMRQDLKRASAVFEDMLSASTRELAVAGMVIVQDPRFFSVLTLSGTEQVAQLKATVSGVATEFNQITESELFEVTDVKNRTLASVGRTAVAQSSRAALVKRALKGHSATGVLIDSDQHYLVSVTPVMAGGRIVGTLLLGEGIGRDLALKLRNLTRSEVTFLCGRSVTGTTLGSDAERATAFAALDRLRVPVRNAAESGHVFEVVGPQERYLTIAAPIPGSDPASGQVYVIQRSLDAETAALTRMQRALLLLGLFAAVVALLSGLLVAETVTSPLRKLVRGAEEMERGNYDYDLQIPSRDEVGYLTVRFLEMRKHQRNYVRNLEEMARVKSEFISVASHELRTPISIIRCYHELMTDGELGPVTPAQVSALSAIDESLARLSKIAEDATVMSQVESRRFVLSRSPSDVTTLIEAAVGTARTSARGRQVSIDTEFERGLSPADVDGPQLAHAVTQLVTNAIRFTPDGGRILVRMQYDTHTDEIVISVEDTGVGIPADRQARIFERGMPIVDSLHHHSSIGLDFNSGGMGFGLSTAHGIIEAHGGTITLESEVGQGSRFEIRIPMRDPYLEAAA